MKIKFSSAWLFSTPFGFNVWWFSYLSSKGISSWQLKAVIMFWTIILPYFIIKRFFEPSVMFTGVHKCKTKCDLKLQMTMCLIKRKLDWNNVIHAWIHLLAYGKSPNHEEKVNVESMCINSMILSNMYSSRLMQFFIGNNTPVPQTLPI